MSVDDCLFEVHVTATPVALVLDRQLRLSGVAVIVSVKSGGNITVTVAVGTLTLLEECVFISEMS